MASLASVIAAASETGLRRRIGVVASTSPLVVTIAGADTPMTGYLGSYAPTVGHVVLVLVDDAGAAIVAGRVMPA